MTTETATESSATTANVDATATQTAATETTATTAKAADTATTTATEGDKTGLAKVEGEQVKEVAATGAPESYADFKAPEGVALDAGLLTQFKEAAKANNLPQDKAQEFVNLGAKIVENTLKSFQDAHAAQIQQWAEQTKADPEVGGPKYDENVALALKAVAQFGDADLKQVFDTYGLGNNPAIVRAFCRVGKAMSEGGFVHGKGQEQPAPHVNREQALIDRMAKEQARGKQT
jgi:hypothetical protein